MIKKIETPDGAIVDVNSLKRTNTEEYRTWLINTLWAAGIVKAYDEGGQQIIYEGKAESADQGEPEK